MLTRRKVEKPIFVEVGGGAAAPDGHGHTRPDTTWGWNSHTTYNLKWLANNRLSMCVCVCVLSCTIQYVYIIYYTVDSCRRKSFREPMGHCPSINPVCGSYNYYYLSALSPEYAFGRSIQLEHPGAPKNIPPFFHFCLSCSFPALF